MPRKKSYQWNVEESDNNDVDRGPSRSAKKRESLALQDMGEELTRLAPQERQRLDLPQDLNEALALYDRIRNHEGRRRQLQYIGRLMRDLDAGPLRAALAARRDIAAAASARFHQAEQWRNRLLTAPEAELAGLLETLLEAHTDGQQRKLLHRLTLEARAEQEQNSAPHARRALFRAIAGLLTPASDDQSQS